MCFIVPFSHPLGQIMTSLNPYDKIWNFSHSLCVLLCPSLTH
jgi:hypothetical protein